MPPYTARQSGRTITPWPPRSSEGLRRYARRVNRVSRLRSLRQILTFGVLIAVAAYWWGSWVAGGWFAVAGWFVLITSLLILVGWVLEHLGLVSVVREVPERITRRYIWDPACR